VVDQICQPRIDRQLVDRFKLLHIGARLAQNQVIEIFVSDRTASVREQIPQAGAIAAANAKLPEILRIGAKIFFNQQLFDQLLMQRFVINNDAVEVKQNGLEH
jgi:hypothetical protein